MAIGNGYGLHNSLSVGVISARGRTLRGEATDLQVAFIQTNAAINPGNSGGSLLNSDGEVVGINDAMNPHAQSIGFAIGAQRPARPGANGTDLPTGSGFQWHDGSRGRGRGRSGVRGTGRGR
jgi:hypothetical protein